MSDNKNEITSDMFTLDQIHTILVNESWDAETTRKIAEILRLAGRNVNEPINWWVSFYSSMTVTAASEEEAKNTVWRQLRNDHSAFEVRVHRYDDTIESCDCRSCVDQEVYTRKGDRCTT